MIFLLCFEFKCLPSISGFYQFRNARFADLSAKCVVYLKYIVTLLTMIPRYQCAFIN